MKVGIAQEKDNCSRENSGYSKIPFRGRLGLINFVYNIDIKNKSERQKPKISLLDNNER